MSYEQDFELVKHGHLLVELLKIVLFERKPKVSPVSIHLLLIYYRLWQHLHQHLDTLVLIKVDLYLSKTFTILRICIKLGIFIFTSASSRGISLELVNCVGKGIYALSQFVSRYGLSETILSDNGIQFSSQGSQSFV